MPGHTDTTSVPSNKVAAQICAQKKQSLLRIPEKLQAQSNVHGSRPTTQYNVKNENCT